MSTRTSEAQRLPDPSTVMHQLITTNGFSWPVRGRTVGLTTAARVEQGILELGTLEPLRVRWQLADDRLWYEAPAGADDASVLAAGALAEAHAFIRLRVLRLEGNWLLARRERDTAGLLGGLLAWLAWQDLRGSAGARVQLRAWLETHLHEAAPWGLEHLPPEEVMAAYMQPLFHGRTDVRLFVLEARPLA